MSPHRIEIRGTTLLLRPERAVFWPDDSTLLVADVHLGKDATFRAEAVPVPLGSTESDLRRLGRVLDRTGAERLIVLGDLYHAAAGMGEPTTTALRQWRKRHQSLAVDLVRGNHDKNAGPSPEELDITEYEGTLLRPPFHLRHRPEPQDDGYVIAGHQHPAVRVSGAGGQQERLPCFHVTPTHLVLPAFGEFTGTHRIHPGPDDQVFVVAEETVLPRTRRRTAVDDE